MEQHSDVPNNVDTTAALEAMGAIPAGAESMAWQVVYGDSRRGMAIGNMLGNDMSRIATGCATNLVHSLVYNKDYVDFYRAIEGLRQRLAMAEAVARMVEATKATRAPEAC